MAGWWSPCFPCIWFPPIHQSVRYNRWNSSLIPAHSQETKTFSGKLKEVPSEGVASCRREQELGQCPSWRVRMECRTWLKEKNLYQQELMIQQSFPSVSHPRQTSLTAFKFVWHFCADYLGSFLQETEEILLAVQLRKFPLYILFFRKPARPYQQKGKLTRSALWERDRAGLSQSRGGCGCCRAAASSLLHYGALPMSLALRVAGFVLLVWHRETNETSQHIWKAAVTTDMNETVAWRGWIVCLRACI